MAHARRAGKERWQTLLEKTLPQVTPVDVDSRAAIYAFSLQPLALSLQFVPYPIPKLRTLLWRGWRKKCPQCGQGALYKRWLTLHERCPVCGLQYLANQGDLFGALMFLDRVLFIIPLIVLFYFRVWHPN